MRDDAALQTAQAQGLPLIDGKQAVAHARRNRSNGAINWYHLEDGTEAVRDDAGNEADWPA